MAVMPPITGGATWANLVFAGPYMKMHPVAAPTPEQGLVQAELDFAMAKAQNKLFPIMLQYFDDSVVAAWTGGATPPQLIDWATELAAAYVLHQAAASSQLERKKDFKDWFERVCQMVIDWLEEGKPLVEPSGAIIDQRENKLTAARENAIGSDPAGNAVFDERVIEDMVENHALYPRSYTREDE